MTTTGLETQYRAGIEGAILVDRSATGRLALRGPDALDLLHRLTTNDLKNLKPGEGTATVFTTSKGRILDLVTLHYLEDRLLCITGEGRAADLKGWIERYTFREQVTVEDETASQGTLGFFGPRAAVLIAELFGKESAAAPLHHATGVAVGNIDAMLVRTFPVAGEGFLLTAEAASIPTIRAGLLLAGEGRVVEAGAECFEVLRIEAGLPAAGRELTLDYNPWEARLGDAISLDKGCYVGQEVIARLNTYKKVSKQLVRLGMEGGPVPAAGTPLQYEGRPIGKVTSAARVPGLQRNVALAYVNDEDAIHGRDILAGTGEELTPARIEGLAR